MDQQSQAKTTTTMDHQSQGTTSTTTDRQSQPTTSKMSVRFQDEVECQYNSQNDFRDDEEMRPFSVLDIFRDEEEAQTFSSNNFSLLLMLLKLIKDDLPSISVSTGLILALVASNCFLIYLWRRKRSLYVAEVARNRSSQDTIASKDREIQRWQSKYAKLQDSLEGAQHLVCNRRQKEQICRDRGKFSVNLWQQRYEDLEEELQMQPNSVIAVWDARHDPDQALSTALKDKEEAEAAAASYQKKDEESESLRRSATARAYRAEQLATYEESSRLDNVHNKHQDNMRAQREYYESKNHQLREEMKEELKEKDKQIVESRAALDAYVRISNHILEAKNKQIADTKASLHDHIRCSVDILEHKNKQIANSRAALEDRIQTSNQMLKAKDTQITNLNISLINARNILEYHRRKAIIEAKAEEQRRKADAREAERDALPLNDPDESDDEDSDETDEEADREKELCDIAENPEEREESWVDLEGDDSIEETEAEYESYDESYNDSDCGENFATARQYPTCVCQVCSHRALRAPAETPEESEGSEVETEGYDASEESNADDDEDAEPSPLGEEAVLVNTPQSTSPSYDFVDDGLAELEGDAPPLL